MKTMSIVPIAPRLATAMAWSGVTSWPASWSRLSMMACAWSWVDLTETDRVQPRLGGRDDDRDIRADLRQRAGELRDRGDIAWAMIRSRNTITVTIAA